MSRVVRLVLATVAVIMVVAIITALGVIDGDTAIACLIGAHIVLYITLMVGSGVPEAEGWGPVLLQGRADTGAVALTFDDAPVPETLPDLLAALAESGATATFFLLLDRAEAHPDLVREIGQRHEIALHGVEHTATTVFKDPAAAADELRAAAQRLAALSGRPVRFYRPPFGATSPRLYAAVEHAGLVLTWCSIRTWDGGPTTAEAIRERAGRAQAGDIVLLHDGRPLTVAALPVILSDLGERGLVATGLSALVED